MYVTIDDSGPVLDHIHMHTLPTREVSVCVRGLSSTSMLGQ